MGFYDSQPTGRLLNRLTKDTESVDLQVGAWVDGWSEGRGEGEGKKGGGRERGMDEEREGGGREVRRRRRLAAWRTWWSARRRQHAGCCGAQVSSSVNQALNCVVNAVLSVVVVSVVTPVALVALLPLGLLYYRIQVRGRAHTTPPPRPLPFSCSAAGGLEGASQGRCVVLGPCAGHVHCQLKGTQAPRLGRLLAHLPALFRVAARARHHPRLRQAAALFAGQPGAWLSTSPGAGVGTTTPLPVGAGVRMAAALRRSG